MTSFHPLLDAVDLNARWFLGGINMAGADRLDSRNFIRGQPVSIQSSQSDLTIRVRRDGRPLDFTFADFDAPVLTSRAADILARFAPGAMQRTPARVEGYPGAYEVVNVTRTIRCLDERRSGVISWTQRDSRPDKIGQYRMVTGHTLDPARIGEEHLFRLEGYSIRLYASSTVLRALYQAAVTGIDYEASRTGAPPWI